LMWTEDEVEEGEILRLRECRVRARVSRPPGRADPISDDLDEETRRMEEDIEEDEPDRKETSRMREDDEEDDDEDE